MPTEKDDSAANQRTSARFLRILAISFAALLLIPMAFLVLLHAPWMQQEIIRQGLKRIEKLADVRIEAGSCRLSPLTVIHIESLRVKSSHKDFILSDKVELAFHLQWSWPYVSPRVVFFDRPVIYLEKDHQGRWRIPRGETVASHLRIAGDRVNRWIDFSWPEVRIQSGRIFAFQNGEMILSLQNLSGVIPYRVVTGEGGPTFIIDLGQWR